MQRINKPAQQANPQQLASAPWAEQPLLHFYELGSGSKNRLSWSEVSFLEFLSQAKKSKFLQIKPFDTFFCDYTNFLLLTKNVNVPSQQCKAIFIPAFDDEITFFQAGIRTQKLKNCAVFIWLLSLPLAENRCFEQNNIKFRKKKPTVLSSPTHQILFNCRGANKSAKMINVIFVPHKLT